MSIDSISTNNSALTSTQFSSVSSVKSARHDGDGDDQGVRKTGGGGRAGKFREAISDALAQLGISAVNAGSSAASGTSGVAATASPDGSSDVTASKTPKQALDSFVQSLFAALHAQTQTAQAPKEGGGIDALAGAERTRTAGTSNARHHRHSGGVGKLEGDLQSLIKELSANTSSTSTTDFTTLGVRSTTGTYSSGSGTLSPTVTQLQQNFSALLSADGSASGSASLGNFLQTLSHNLQGAPASGNIVNTKV